MPSRDSKRNQQGNYNTYGYANGRNGGGGGGGGAARNHVVPSEPPFTAYIGNAPDSMVQGDFESHLFIGLKVKQVRLVRDRQTDRFRGFAYVDFEDGESLRRAIELDGTFINDRPIRINVAARPLGGGKTEGFRNKPNFESRDDRRYPSGNNNNNNNGSRQGGRGNNNYNQPETPQTVEDGYNDGYHAERNRRSSGSGKTTERRHSQSHQHKTPPRHPSNDDVFIAPDTPISNEDGIDQTNTDQGNTTIGRQQTRNWADCPIDESVAEPSPPPSANNTLSGDNFQVVRNKNPKFRSNQQPSARPMDNQSGRGRNNGSYNRGEGSQMASGRGYYDQMPPQYQNQSQQYYHHQQQQQAPPPLHMGLSYHMNNNRQQPSSGSRQRLNSNRSNNSRGHQDNNERPTKGDSENSNSTDNNSAPAENRPRLQLLPRSQKLSSSTDDNQTPEPAARNANIFGCGKPRDERDPKVAELTKHIEEVVEKEQHVPRTKSTASNDSTDGVTKPVRILTAATKSLIDQ